MTVLPDVHHRQTPPLAVRDSRGVGTGNYYDGHTLFHLRSQARLQQVPSLAFGMLQQAYQQWALVQSVGPTDFCPSLLWCEMRVSKTCTGPGNPRIFWEMNWSLNDPILERINPLKNRKKMILSQFFKDTDQTFAGGS